MWDLQQSLEVIFPWEYLSEDKILTLEGWEGINWLVDIFYWGNQNPEGMVLPMSEESNLTPGPSGFLDKKSVNDRKAELVALGWMCEGLDTTRCPWPAGEFSLGDAYCAPGFAYSELEKRCFAEPFGHGDCTFDLSCAPKDPASCGESYTGICKGNSFLTNCYHSCQAKPLAADALKGLDHFVCQKDGTWLNMADYHTVSLDTLTWMSGSKLHNDREAFPCTYPEY